MNKPSGRLAKRSGIRSSATAGNLVADNQSVLTAGPRGPLLQQDCRLIEKLTLQNRERFSPRPVHAKGWRAYETLTNTKDIPKFTRAKLLQPGARTDLILRCSTVTGEHGADAERDVRGSRSSSGYRPTCAIKHEACALRP